MPYAVTHILVPIILVAFFRDFYLREKHRRHFPLHYLLIAGLGGVLPDIDIPISFLLNLAGVGNWNIHRLITHSILFPIILFVLFAIFSFSDSKARICNLTRHNLKLSKIFLMLSIGVAIHILLDFSFPYFTPLFSIDVQDLVAPTLDGILLVIWIVYLELKHKISDFI